MSVWLQLFPPPLALFTASSFLPPPPLHSLLLPPPPLHLLLPSHSLPLPPPSSSGSRVSSEEKVLIKGLLLENLDEPSDQITRQVDELMARIAHSGCPHDWPELLPTLTESVQGGSSLLRWRSLFFLYRVIKTLSSNVSKRIERLSMRCYSTHTRTQYALRTFSSSLCASPPSCLCSWLVCGRVTVTTSLVIWKEGWWQVEYRQLAGFWSKQGPA